MYVSFQLYMLMIYCLYRFMHVCHAAVQNCFQLLQIRFDFPWIARMVGMGGGPCQTHVENQLPSATGTLDHPSKLSFPVFVRRFPEIFKHKKKTFLTKPPQTETNLTRRSYGAVPFHAP